MVPFSLSEEAFLFRNVRDIVNVWSGGSGQARLNIFVNNGQAELQLTFRLGHPEASHLPLPHTPVLQQNRRPVQHPPLRKKSQRRQARDNLRAAKFQAARRAATSSSSSSPPLISVLSTRTFTPTFSSTSTPVIPSSGLVTQPSIGATTVTSSTPSLISYSVACPSASSSPALLDYQAESFPPDQSMVSVTQEDSVPSLPATTFTPFTMPPRQFVDCTHCAVDIEDHIQPIPCYNCGEWFHLRCIPGHNCALRNDIPIQASDFSYSLLD